MKVEVTDDLQLILNEYCSYPRIQSNVMLEKGHMKQYFNRW